MDNQLANINEYIKFQYRENYIYEKGWDKFAEEYSHLLKPFTIYYLTKEIAHTIVSELVPKNKEISVLDLNCGTGNDFPFFLKQRWKICGSDGSAGMLNKAFKKYSSAIKSGNIELFLGKLEYLDETSFKNKKFDLIFSITGGFSYINNEMFLSVNRILSSYLKDDGIIITAHLNSFCLPDMLYNLFRLKVKKAFQRFRKNLIIDIKGEKYSMFLRNASDLEKLVPDELKIVKSLPLLAFTPPYQTGYKPSKFLYNIHKWIELRICKISFFLKIADQIVLIYKKSKISNS